MTDTSTMEPTTEERRVVILREAVQEAINQLEYLDERFPTGTTPCIITRLKAALNDAG